MLDRATAPAFGTIKDVILMEPAVHHLDNGIPVFSIDAGTQDVTKVELIFNGGTAVGNKLLVASSTSKLLTSGTSQRTAAQIAEAVDFYGAYLQAEISHDDCSLQLFTLSKHLHHTLPILAEVYADAVFPEEELTSYVRRSKQEMLVNLEKVGYLATKGFAAALYGKDHVYGRSASVSDYDQLTQDDLISFYQEHICGHVKHILVSGRLRTDTFNQLNAAFGSATRKPLIAETVTIVPQDVHKLHVDKLNAVQNSIKVGRVLFERKHPDFVGVQVLCTVLGGYFGSRLMSNIREDKGYTYGIGAGLVSMTHSTYLSISTEVGADVCKPAIDEIFKEMELLMKDPISISELELVRNYMLGAILKSVDGPFSIAAKWRNYLKHDLSMSSHNKLIREIQHITPERLRELANTYLQHQDLVVVTAGRPLSH